MGASSPAVWSRSSDRRTARQRARSVAARSRSDQLNGPAPHVPAGAVPGVRKQRMDADLHRGLIVEDLDAAALQPGSVVDGDALERIVRLLLTRSIRHGQAIAQVDEPEQDDDTDRPAHEMGSE